MRAGRLLRQLDAGAGYRDQIEKEIEMRLGRGPQGSAPHLTGSAPHLGGSAPHMSDAASHATDAARTLEVRELLAARACVACHTANDPDAKFCKNCGKSMGESL
jgi:hypothetical protein